MHFVQTIIVQSTSTLVLKTALGAFVREGGEQPFVVTAFQDTKDTQFSILLLFLAILMLTLLCSKLLVYMAEMRLLSFRRFGHQDGGCHTVSAYAFSPLDMFARSVLRIDSLSTERLESRISYLTDRYARHAMYWQMVIFARQAALILIIQIRRRLV